MSEVLYLQQSFANCMSDQYTYFDISILYVTAGYGGLFYGLAYNIFKLPKFGISKIQNNQLKFA